MRFKKTWFFVLLAYWMQTVNSANILGIFPTNTQSHYVMYGSLMKELAAKGHHVTVVNHFPQKKQIKNFVDISLDGTLPALSNNISIDVPMSMSPIASHIDTIYDCIESCEIGFNHPEVVELFNSTKYHFDLFITEIFGSECFLAVAHKLEIPSVGVVSSVNLPWVNDMVANPDNPAYIPLYFYPLTQWMNFYERLYNTVMSVIIKVSYDVLANWPAHKIAESVMGPLPSISHMARNFSMILVNSHFSINQVRPWVPQIVEVGGLHIKKTGKMPKDIQKWLEESPHGVVYFSFGSMMKVESFPPEKLQGIINALGKLQQRVLWKANLTHAYNLPENIKTGMWMPQLEILCHPATKLFISHGGLLGSQEAISCGVPILGVPLFADQALNLVELKRRGVAEVITYHDLNENTFSEGLGKLINDSSYQEKMTHLSQLFTDRPQHPMDTAVYWLEYVIKYKGARHLRSPALDLTWYQYLLLDVIAFLIAAAILAFYLCKYLIKKLIQAFTVPQESLQQNNIVRSEIDDINEKKESNGYIEESRNFVNSSISNSYYIIDKQPNKVYQKENSNLNIEKIINRIEQLYDFDNHKKWE